MALYQVTPDSLDKIEQTTFARQGIKERNDLQRLLKKNISVLADGVLVIAEEFGEWEGSNRRIDLLAVDRNANIVVIELKRTEDGGHMELQAIRYAAMLSTMTFEQAVRAFSSYLQANDMEGDAEETLLGFLEWEEPDEDQFAQDVRIILASAEFSKELTTSVIWLNDRNLDIRCIRMKPYVDGEKTLLDVQQVIPLPETNDYQVRVREKQQKERQARSDNRDFTRYDLYFNENSYTNLPKRWLIFHLIHDAIHSGKSVTEIQSLLSWRGDLFEVFDGELTSLEVIDAMIERYPERGQQRVKRFFCNEGEVFPCDGKTYVLTNQWGRKTKKAADAIVEAYPELGIEIQASNK